jgi:hypothetical protein
MKLYVYKRIFPNSFIQGMTPTDLTDLYDKIVPTLTGNAGGRTLLSAAGDGSSFDSN